jgi:hypothetical protein
MIEVTLTTGFFTPNMSKKVTLIRRAKLLAVPAVGTILSGRGYNVTVRSVRFHLKSVFIDCFEYMIGSDTGTTAANAEELEAAVAAYEHNGWKRISSEPEPVKLNVAVDRLKEEMHNGWKRILSEPELVKLQPKMTYNNPESLPTFVTMETVIYKFNGVLYLVSSVWPNDVYEISVVSNGIPKSDVYPNIYVHASFLMPYSTVKTESEADKRIRNLHWNVGSTAPEETQTKADIGKMIEMSDCGPECL